MLTEDQELELTSGRTCELHTHDWGITRDQLKQLNALENVRTLSSSGDVVDSDDIILLDSTAGAFAAYLPRARGGKRLFFTRISGSNNITLTPNGSDTVNGNSSLVISNSYSPVSLKAISTGWITT